ncbi:type II secretion system F family protein [Actinomyces urinae]|uniref:type II secretion system F family protein n=1 Tax=Actinomyces urinae TaxID=1689268 RepID=UPI00092FE023|nr:type II secretion system F family protein [Actinomyces urinae]
MSALAALAWTLLFVLFASLLVGRRRREQRALTAWKGAREVERKPAEQVSAAMLLADVVARLRSGAGVEAAWRGAILDADLPWGGMDSRGVPQLPKQLRGSASSVEAACRLTHQIGAPLAQILESILETIDEVDAANRDREVARAGPETTAKLLTALPLLGVVAGFAVGVDVVGLWFAGGVATVGLVVGALFWVAGVVWAKRLIAAASLEGERIDLVVLVDLLVASLSSGASIPHSLDALGVACGESQFERCAALLRIGAPFDALQEQVSEDALPIVAALRPAWTLGASPIPMLRVFGGRIRATRAAKARGEAQRLAVRLVLPLGLCLLPAFVAISVVPIVASISLPGF